jgi:hypothetical protein
MIVICKCFFCDGFGFTEDNFGISMVLFCFFLCVNAEDANDGAKLKKEQK